MNFKHLTYLCMQRLTNFPYIEEDFDALTNYELLCKVVEYLNKVIANENNQNEAIAELATSLTELKNYVDNLDLQDEVNNKLDEMAENGQLADIIAQYLGLAGMITFDTVSDMKSAENLVNGSKCATLGYYSVNDGGNAFYKVRTVTNDDVVDEATIISLNDNTLIAELIIENYELNIKQFGAYGDDSHNDYLAFTKLFKFLSDNYITTNIHSNKYIKYNINIPKGIYLIENSDLLSLLSNQRATFAIINGNDSILHFNTVGYGFNINDSLLNITFKDLEFSSDNSNFVLFNTISSGGTQGLKFINCTYLGEYSYVYHLTGANNNSEFLFDNCTMSGSWLSFLYTESSDQFVNYWFNNCKYWNSHQFIKAPKGGHFKLNNCDISGYQPIEDTYLYELGSGSGNYGVQTFIDTGSRYELKTTYAKVINSNWDQGQIIFENCDFSSSSSIHEASDSVYKITNNSSSGSLTLFNNCKLLGKFYVTGNGTHCIKILNCIIYGIDTTSSENIESFINIPTKTNPNSPYVVIEKCRFANNVPFNSSYKMNNTGGILETSHNILKCSSNYNQIDNGFSIPIYKTTTIYKNTVIPRYYTSGYSTHLIVKSKIGTISSIVTANRSFYLTTDLFDGIKKGMKLCINGVIGTIDSVLLANKQITFTSDVSMSVDDDVYIVLNDVINYPNRNIQNSINNEVYLINSNIICDVITESTTKSYFGYLLLELCS